MIQCWHAQPPHGPSDPCSSSRATQTCCSRTWTPPSTTCGPTPWTCTTPTWREWSFCLAAARARDGVNSLLREGPAEGCAAHRAGPTSLRCASRCHACWHDGVRAGLGAGRGPGAVLPVCDGLSAALRCIPHGLIAPVSSLAPVPRHYANARHSTFGWVDDKAHLVEHKVSGLVSHITGK